MSERFVKLPVKIKYEEWYLNDNACRLYVHCLICAAYTEHQGSKGDMIKKGEFPTSYKTLAAETGLSVQQVRSALDKLEATRFITRMSTQDTTRSKGTVIKVLDVLSHTSCNTNGNTNVNNPYRKDIDKDIEGLYKEKKDAARVPSLSEVEEYAISIGRPDTDCKRFVEYNESKGWITEDWKQAFDTFSEKFFNKKRKDTAQQEDDTEWQ